MTHCDLGGKSSCGGIPYSIRGVDSKDYNNKTPIPSLYSVNMFIFESSEHTCYAASSNTVWGWGAGQNGCLLDKVATTSPHILYSLPPNSHVKIVQIFAGMRTCGVVLSDGRLLTWGCFFWGSGHEKEVAVPTCPPGAENFKVVFGAFIGIYSSCHLVVVEENGLCWEKEKSQWKKVSLDDYFPRLISEENE